MSLSDSVCSWLPPIREKKQNLERWFSFVSVYTYSLHEHISGSIVCMNMFCILWMLYCFACQLPGSDNVPFVCCCATAFSLHFKGGFCWLFLNVKGKQTLSSSLLTRFHSYSILITVTFFCGCFFFIEHISHEIQLDFDFTLLSLLLRSNKRYALSLYSNQGLQGQIGFGNPEWTFPRA